MKIDPNDLQGTCDHRKWEAATDSCAICGKDWNTILWQKPCCGGGAGPMQYVGGKWHDADCAEAKRQFQQQIDSCFPPDDYRLKPAVRCQCGAQATSNPNCHSLWCPEYKK